MAENGDYDMPDNILQRYGNADLAAHTMRQMRGIMHHHHIPYRDDNNNILDAFRARNGNFIPRRQPYIDAIVQHFAQQPQNQPAAPPNQPPAPPNQPNNPQQPVNQNMQILSVAALQQILQSINDKKEQKFDRKFHGKQDESVQDFIKYCNTYRELYSKTEDWMYKKILTYGLQDYAARVAHDNRGTSYYDLKSLYDWLYVQFYGEQQLEIKKKSWEEFEQIPQEAIDVCYYRYVAVKSDYERAIEFAAERGANSSLNVAPTEKEAFTKFFNGLYKETQLVLLTQIEVKGLDFKLNSVQQVLKSVKALTVSAHGLRLKYSYDQRSAKNQRHQNNQFNQNNYGQQQRRNRNHNQQNNNRPHNQGNYSNQNQYCQSNAQNKYNNKTNQQHTSNKNYTSHSNNPPTANNGSSKKNFNPHANKTCYNCGEQGHIATNCRNKSKRNQNNQQNDKTHQSNNDNDDNQNHAAVIERENVHTSNRNNMWQYPDHFYLMEKLIDYSEDEESIDTETHSLNCQCFTCIQESLEEPSLDELMKRNDELLNQSESIEFDVESTDIESDELKISEVKETDHTLILIIITVMKEMLLVLQFIWLLFRIIHDDLKNRKVTANHGKEEAESMQRNIKQESSNDNGITSKTNNTSIRNNVSEFINGETCTSDKFASQSLNDERMTLIVQGEKNLVTENQFYKWIKRISTRYKEEF